MVVRAAAVGGQVPGGRERPWSMSVVLVSSGKAWICTDLIS